MLSSGQSLLFSASATSAPVEVCPETEEYTEVGLIGEGLANFVVAATRDGGQRVVWRFRKHKQRKNQLLLKPEFDTASLAEYINGFIVPYLGRKLISAPRLALFGRSAVFRIFGSNNLLAKYLPPDIPEDSFPIAALEMPNFTRYFDQPHLKDVPFVGPTISVEIKPKQGFFSDIAPPDAESSLVSRSPYCLNCLFQLEKCARGVYEMYDFCPLDLYSGHWERMMRALNALIVSPHRNLRLFCNGRLLHSNEHFLREEQLLANLRANGREWGMESFLELLCRLLSGCLEEDSMMAFSLRPGSVLHSLLNVQKLDTIGLEGAFRLFDSLPEAVQAELKDPHQLYSAVGYEALLRMAPEHAATLNLLQGYLTAATIKDCSVMITLREVAAEFGGEDSSLPLVPLRESTNVRRRFAYNVVVIDLDAKPPKKLEYNRGRLLEAFRVLDEHIKRHAGDISTLRQPCQLRSL